MVDLNALNEILSTRNGVWATFLVVLLLAWRGWPHVPAIMSAWVARRQAIQAAKDADWVRIRDEATRLDERCQRLEESEERCREELRDVKDRLAQVEGFMIGQGHARQDAARIVAVERLEDKKGEGK